jgi:DNA invertase Pin-like site-specific DNA recombinase
MIDNVYHNVGLRTHDQAHSGGRSDRPGLAALLAAAPAREFDVVLVDGLFRLARDKHLMLSIIAELHFEGIRVISVAHGLDSTDEESTLAIQVRGIFNELQLRDLKTKTLRGQRGQKERGFFVGERTFGYRSVPVGEMRMDKKGRPRPDGDKMEIEPKEAATVLRIFTAYGSGDPLTKIVRTLNEENVPGSIRSHDDEGLRIVPQPLWNGAGASQRSSPGTDLQPGAHRVRPPTGRGRDRQAPIGPSRHARAEGSRARCHQRRLANVVDFICDGRGSQALALALVETERRVDGLTEELDGLRRSREKVFRAPPIEWIRERLSNLHEILEHRTARSAQALRNILGPIRLELVTPDIGRPFYRAFTTLDALALMDEPPSTGAEGGSNSLRRWRRRESNPRPRSRKRWRLRA